jgi:hypothetical protein
MVTAVQVVAVRTMSTAALNPDAVQFAIGRLPEPVTGMDWCQTTAVTVLWEPEVVVLRW